MSELVEDLANALEGACLPQIILDDTPEDEVEAIRARQRPGYPPIIRFRGVSIAEYEQEEEGCHERVC
jgi:hypothetical protein